MSKKAIIIWVIVVIVVGVGAFFGGSAYGQSQAASSRPSFTAGAGRAGFAGRTGATGAASASGSATVGTIISTSPTSVTIQLRTGSTQIVFISSSTPIMKAITGTIADLAPGDQITVVGTANSDGSLTAATIQLRPATTTIMTSSTAS